VTPSDTIVAIASPAGRGAVGVIRISGADVPRVAVALLGALPHPRVAHLGDSATPMGPRWTRGLPCTFPHPPRSPANMSSSCKVTAAHSSSTGCCIVCSGWASEWPVPASSASERS